MTPKQKREEIKRLLSLLNKRNHTVFNLMYSPDNTNNDVNDTVDKMPAKQLNWALTQCQNTYYNLFKVIKGTK